MLQTVLRKKRVVMEILGQCEGSANKGTRGTADDLNAIPSTHRVDRRNQPP